MAERFVYDCTDIDKQYDRARELPLETYRVWADAIAVDLPRDGISRICDVGCGTGRFTALLADVFSAQVVGVDPSEKMLAKAKRNISIPGIEFAVGTAEALPLDDGTADALFLSMSYHHIQDTSRALSEFQRVLRKPGYVIIRTSTHQSMRTYPWLQFFPAAREIEMNRTSDRTLLVDFFEACGFNLLRHGTIDQQFAGDYLEYFSKLSSRGLSSLKAISDAEFRKGCNRLEDFCRQQPSDSPVFEEIDLYAFTW